MNNDYQHILLATDFSPFSKHAARRAMKLASYCDETRLTFIHVIDEDYYDEFGSVFSGLATGGGFTNQQDVLLKEAQDQMLHFTNKLDANDVQTKVVKGIPRKTIMTFAKTHHIDLIVMGAHGRHGLARLLGSTTNNVMNYSQCDVLAVYMRNV